MRDRAFTDEIFNRQTTIESKRLPAEYSWDLLARYIAPWRQLEMKYGGDQNPNVAYGEDVYDGSIINNVKTFARGTVSVVMPRNQNWFKYGLEDEELDDLPDVRQYMQGCEKVVYRLLRDSEVYDESVEYVKNGGVFGMANMWCYENLKKGKIIFKLLPLPEVYIARDKDDEVDVLHRVFYLTGRRILQMFGENKLSESLKKQVTEEQFGLYKMLHVLMPRTERIKGMSGNNNMPIASFWYEFEETHLLQESGYEDMPIFTWCPQKGELSDYGQGPGHDSLIQVAAAHGIFKDMMEMAEKAAKPAMNVPFDQMGYADFRPDGMNYFQNSQIATPVVQSYQWPLPKEILLDLRASTEKAFHVPFFQTLQNIEAGKMTAWEGMERKSEDALQLGPLVGTLNTMFLDKMHTRVFGIAFRAGLLPPLPPVLQKYAGAKIKIDYMGPFAQAQERYHRSQGLAYAWQRYQTLVRPTDPQTVDNFDVDFIARELVEGDGMPAQGIRPASMRDEIRQARVEEQEKREQMAQVAEMAKAAPGLGKAPEEGSALDRALGGGA